MGRGGMVLPHLPPSPTLWRVSGALTRGVTRMCNSKFYPKGLTPLETGPGIVERLAGLRRAFEKGGNTKIYEFTAPVILLLADVCEALGLGKEEQAQVLGREGAKQVQRWGDTPVRLNGKKNRKRESASEGGKGAPKQGR